MHLLQKKKKLKKLPYVLHSFQTRPGPRPGFQVLTGSSGRSDQIFFKSKRRRFSKKIKVNGLQLGLAGSTKSTGFFPLLFFFNPTRFQPRARSGFKIMIYCNRAFFLGRILLTILFYQLFLIKKILTILFTQLFIIGFSRCWEIFFDI